jgi:hypothetical protein
MFEISPTAIEQYVFNKTINGTLIGGFPLTDFIKSENHDNDVGISRFENLVVPVGLISYVNKPSMQTGGNAHYKPKKEIVGDVMDSDEFDKLFYKMTKQTVKNNSRKIKIKSDHSVTKRNAK